MKKVLFSWAFGKVLRDWRKRRPKQLRETLPPDYTASILRYIRINACRNTAPKTIECAKWCQTDPHSSNSENQQTYDSFITEKDQGPFIKTHDYVCNKCKHPEITIDILANKLGLDRAKNNFSARTLQRYMNSEEPMPIAQFRRAVANAFVYGWLGVWQSVSIWMHINEMETTRRSLVAVLRRAMERKEYLLKKVLKVSEQDIEKELDKQQRLAENEATRTIHKHLQDHTLAPSVRKFMEEALLAIRQHP